MEGKVGQLWRLNVIDMASGVCLFEKIWTWPEVSIDKKLDLCKLVKSFFLLSGDFGEDKGEIIFLKDCHHHLPDSSSSFRFLSSSFHFSFLCKIPDPGIIWFQHTIVCVSQYDENHPN